MTMKRLLPLALIGALAACSTAPALPYISEKARAALPPGTDLSTVWRRDDGCYFIQTRDDLTGYLLMVKDESGLQVCDPV